MKALSIINVVLSVTFLVLFLAFLSSEETFTVKQLEPIGITYCIWATFYAILSAVKHFKK